VEPSPKPLKHLSTIKMLYHLMDEEEKMLLQIEDSLKEV